MIWLPIDQVPKAYGRSFLLAGGKIDDSQVDPDNPFGMATLPVRATWLASHGGDYSGWIVCTYHDGVAWIEYNDPTHYMEIPEGPDVEPTKADIIRALAAVPPEEQRRLLGYCERPRPVWLVTETAYGKVWGWRHFLDREEAEETARRWRDQSAGVVTVEQVEAPTSCVRVRAWRSPDEDSFGSTSLDERSAPI